MQPLVSKPIFGQKLNMKTSLFAIAALFTAGLSFQAEAQALKTETRKIGSFTGLKTSGNYTILLKKSSEEKVEMIGPEEQVNRVITEVNGDQLSIREKTDGKDWSSGKKGITITVWYKELNSLSSSGSSEISNEEPLNSDKLDISASGSGEIELDVICKDVKASVSGSAEIELKGKTESLLVNVSGSGEVEAFELAAETVTASVSGSGTIETRPSKLLNGRVSGSGDILYVGDPATLDIKTSGSGKIKKLNKVPKD